MTRERTQALISGSQLDLRFLFQRLHLVFDTRGEVVFKVGILWQLKIEFICPLCVWDHKSVFPQWCSGTKRQERTDTHMENLHRRFSVGEKTLQSTYSQRNCAILLALYFHLQMEVNYQVIKQLCFTSLFNQSDGESVGLLWKRKNQRRRIDWTLAGWTASLDYVYFEVDAWDGSSATCCANYCTHWTDLHLRE